MELMTFLVKTEELLKVSLETVSVSVLMDIMEIIVKMHQPVYMAQMDNLAIMEEFPRET